MRLPRAHATLASLTGIALVATACGTEQPAKQEQHSDFARQTVAQIRTAARTDMSSVHSVTIHGSVPADDQEFTITLAEDGSCRGTIEQSGGRAEVVETADGSYVRGNEAFWIGQAGGDAAQEAKVRRMLDRVGGGWIRTPRGTGDLRMPSYFLPQCDFASFLPQLTQINPALATKGEEREIGGEDAVALTSDQQGVTATVWITTAAPHRVLRLTQSGRDGATYTLSDYDDDVEISSPDADEVYDLEAAYRQKAE